ncbi:hypothetical protein LguiA_006548 [Lonicera macranthoides]
MMFSEEPVQFQFSANEISELLSFFQSEVPVNSTSGSETTRSVYSQEERKRRRMISNRESARRSRQRKKSHLENLTTQLNRLRTENRELRNRLCLIAQQNHLVERETQELGFEAMDLQTKLSGLYQILVNMQFSNTYSH